ncbi:MAG: four helix bundle protein [Bacteroidetes bacterium]|nr:four helix bundle protein [Bacteroidota bacterium]
MEHKNLEVWKASMSLSSAVYLLTGLFPKEEKYGLAQQMRRAAVSVPSNIAEGAARSSTKQYYYFLQVARGSASELETQILIAGDLKLIKSDSLKAALEKVSLVRRMLCRQMESLGRRIREQEAG